MKLYGRDEPSISYYESIPKMWNKFKTYDNCFIPEKLERALVISRQDQEVTKIQKYMHNVETKIII